MTDDEDRERILREARENVRRLSDEKPPAEVPPPPAPLAGWKARADERRFERERSRAEIASKPATVFDWTEFDRRIQAAIEIESKLLAEALGQSLARLLDEERSATMRSVRKELRELEIANAKLETKVAELRVEIASDRTRTVVDHPPLRRDVN